MSPPSYRVGQKAFGMMLMNRDLLNILTDHNVKNFCDNDDRKRTKLTLLCNLCPPISSLTGELKIITIRLFWITSLWLRYWKGEHTLSTGDKSERAFLSGTENKIKNQCRENGLYVNDYAVKVFTMIL